MNIDNAVPNMLEEILLHTARKAYEEIPEPEKEKLINLTGSELKQSMRTLSLSGAVMMLLVWRFSQGVDR